MLSLLPLVYASSRIFATASSHVSASLTNVITSSSESMSQTPSDAITNEMPGTKANNLIDSKTSMIFSGVHLSNSSMYTTTLLIVDFYFIFYFLFYSL